MRTNSIFNLLLAIVLLGMTGCTTMGNQYDASRVDDIVVGQTTEAELIDWFGEPQSRTRSSNQEIVLAWTYFHAQTRGSTFIPIAGAFIGGSDQESQNLSVTLDSDGKVKTFSESSGGVGQTHN